MEKVAQLLLQWYKKNGRKLPWRRTRGPYKILVSEIMLQQTQVERVILFYKNWLQRFPDTKSLAKASNKEVIEQWSGLGYNRRALALKEIAKTIEKMVYRNQKKNGNPLKELAPTPQQQSVHSHRKKEHSQ